MASNYSLSDNMSSSPASNSGGKLSDLLRQANAAMGTGKMTKLPDSLFDLIAKNLKETVQKEEWTSRPRTWFILNQINRLDAMKAFIAEGLNDTSLPYKGRRDLPICLTYHEVDAFMKWQGVVDSDVLHFEEGRHIHITDGDVFFDIKRPALGKGSQG